MAIQGKRQSGLVVRLDSLNYLATCLPTYSNSAR